jgi:hypothetical protein
VRLPGAEPTIARNQENVMRPVRVVNIKTTGRAGLKPPKTIEMIVNEDRACRCRDEERDEPPARNAARNGSRRGPLLPAKIIGSIVAEERRRLGRS